MPDPYQPPRTAAGRVIAFEPEATPSGLFRSFPVVLRASYRTVLAPYLLLQGLTILVTVPYSLRNSRSFESLTSGAVPTAAYDPLADLGLMAAMYVALFLVFAVTMGLARPLRQAMTEGFRAVGGFGGALKAAFARFWHIIGNGLLLWLAVALGTVLCFIPGLIVGYLLMVAPYLVAARDEGVLQSMKSSYRMARQHIGPLMAAVGVYVGATTLLSIVYVLVAVAVFATSQGDMTTMMRAMMSPALQVGMSALGIPVGYFMWMWLLSAFITLETAESGETWQVQDG